METAHIQHKRAPHVAQAAIARLHQFLIRVQFTRCLSLLPLELNTKRRQNLNPGGKNADSVLAPAMPGQASSRSENE